MGVVVFGVGFVDHTTPTTPLTTPIVLGENGLFLIIGVSTGALILALLMIQAVLFSNYLNSLCDFLGLLGLESLNVDFNDNVFDSLV